MAPKFCTGPDPDNVGFKCARPFPCDKHGSQYPPAGTEEELVLTEPIPIATVDETVDDAEA